MDDRTILNIRTLAHTDGGNIATQDSARPDTGLRADRHVTNHHSLSVDKRSGMHRGSFGEVPGELPREFLVFSG